MIDGGLNAYHLQYLMFGALWTIGLSLISFVGGGLAGGVIALCRISPIKAVRWATIAWIQLIQGTPLLVVLFLCYFGLSIMGLELPGIVDEVVTLAEIKAEDGSSYRAFVTHTVNPYGFPAKDRSGRLDLLEPPHLGALIAKCAGASIAPVSATTPTPTHIESQE